MLDELRDAAGVLHQHRRRRADGAPRLLRAASSYSIGHGIGVKFSTNGAFIDADEGPTAGGDGLPRHPDQPRRHRRRDQRRGPRRRARTPRPAGRWTTSRDAGFGPFKISVVVTRHNVEQLDEFKALADSYGAQLRVTRLRPSGRGADTWHDLHPTNDQQRQIYRWLLAHGDDVLTGDSFFHLNALGEPLPGLNMCGAGRVVCLIDPIGDVYACPFVIHDQFKAGSVRDAGGFAEVWKHSPLFLELREPQSAGACASCGSYDACQGGCMAAKFFTGLPLDGPDPECVNGHGEQALAAAVEAPAREPGADHSKPVTFLRQPIGSRRELAVAAARTRSGATSSARSRAPRSSPRRRGVDITATGSGNPGASNVTRALGWRKGVLVFALDAAQGISRHGRRAVDRRTTRPATCSPRRRSSGTSYPVTRGRFRGGKGVATGGGACSCCTPSCSPSSSPVVWLAVTPSRARRRSRRSPLVAVCCRSGWSSPARRRGRSPPSPALVRLCWCCGTPTTSTGCFGASEPSLEQPNRRTSPCGCSNRSPSAPRAGAEPDHVRPARHQPRRRRPPAHRPPRRLLPAACAWAAAARS